MLRGLEADDEIVVLETLEAVRTSSDPSAIEPLVRLISRAGTTTWTGARPSLAASIPARAALVLAALAGRSAIRTLIHLAAEDPAPAYRFEEALQQIDPDWRQADEARQALADLLSRPDVARWAAALAWIGDARAVRALLPHLTDPERGLSVRNAVRQLDGDWWKDPEIERRVAQQCARLAEAPAADESIRTLIRIGSPAALAPLLRIVVDDDHPSRCAAELAFFQIASWPESAGQAERLLQPLLTDRRLRLRFFAASALKASIGRPCAVLLSSWKDDAEFIPRLVVARLLDKLGVEKTELAGVQPADATPFCFRCGEVLLIAPLSDAEVTPHPMSGQFPIQPAIEERARAGSVCPACDRILCWKCLGDPDATTCPACGETLIHAMPELCEDLIQRIRPYWS